MEQVRISSTDQLLRKGGANTTERVKGKKISLSKLQDQWQVSVKVFLHTNSQSNTLHLIEKLQVNSISVLFDVRTFTKHEIKNVINACGI